MRYSTPCITLVATLISALATLPCGAVGITGQTPVERKGASTKRTLHYSPAPTHPRTVSEEKLRELAIKNGPLRPQIDQSKRKNFPDPKKHPTPQRRGAFPWHFDITATYFFIGERATARNPVPNTASSWDSAWDDNYGGYDDPDPKKRDPITFAPLGFRPRLNPFYVALPYNDIERGGPKPEAERVIPWYRRDKEGKYESVCRGTWVQIYYKGRYCFAQWEDCGPFVTDDWEYVFKGKRPRNTQNNGAGIDISPAVRDYLGIPGGSAVVHWRFVDFSLVPGGPWARYGKDNPFVNPALKEAIRKYSIKYNIKTAPTPSTKK